MHKNDRKYYNWVYNPETLLYEQVELTPREHFVRILTAVLGTVAFAALFAWIYIGLLGNDLPKTARLKRENAEWVSALDLLDNQLDRQEQVLRGIEDRDDDVYRSIYGLDEIPESVKNAGFGGTDRYGYLDDYGASDLLKYTVVRLDKMTKRAYLQTNALDEVALVSRQAGAMISCVPAVPPICPVRNTYRISSSFGRRIDPVFGTRAFHEGVDFATFKGNPIYATGDGTVEKVRYQFFGYGNELVINHGYGYKTRYAHLNSINVRPGQKVSRGEKVATVGNTGKSTGPHLHYEVIYKGKQVNPSSFYDLTIPVEEYEAMVESHTKQQ